MELSVVARQVSPPVPPQRRDRLIHFVAALQNCGYDVLNCAARLGVFPRLGVSFWPAMRPDWAPSTDDPIDNLLTLFIDGGEVNVDLVAKQISTAFVDAAIEMGLVSQRGRFLQSDISLFPCYGKYFVTDQASRNTAVNQVMWLWGESYLLGGLVKRVPRRRAVDLGTGSGIHAILASDHSKAVVGADVNPRALAFAEFNAALNGRSNLDFVLSDLLESIDGTFDLLLANPPYAPDSAARAGDNYWSGGVSGTELLQRIIEALPTRLAVDGTAHINALYPNPPATTTKSHFDRWLGGALSEWDVLDHTWPVPRYDDLLSEQPFVGDKRAWRFGVVSLRRAQNRTGWWKEVAGKGLFFREDGSCGVVADHDAF